MVRIYMNLGRTGRQGSPVLFMISSIEVADASFHRSLWEGRKSYFLYLVRFTSE